MKHAGAMGRENAGMSNRKISESLVRRKPKVSSAMTIIGGLGVPKDNLAYERGMPMASRLIFRPRLCMRWDDGRHKIGRTIGCNVVRQRMPARQIRQGPQGTFETSKHRLRAESDRRALQEKSLSILNAEAHVPQTDTGGHASVCEGERVIIG